MYAGKHHYSAAFARALCHTAMVTPVAPTRSPYTDACDLIRQASKTPISRLDAALIRQEIATVLGVGDDTLAGILSAEFRKREIAQVAA